MNAFKKTLSREDKKSLLELGECLLDMDDMIEQLDDLSEESSARFRQLSFSIELMIDEPSSEVAQTIHGLLDDIAEDFHQTAPDLAATASKVKSLCVRLGIE